MEGEMAEMKEVLIDAGAVSLFVIVSIFGLCATIHDIVKWYRTIKNDHEHGHAEEESATAGVD